MTIRLHIDRLVVDRSLAGAAIPRDVDTAIETELRRLMRSAAAAPSPTGQDGSLHSTLQLHPRGTFAERLARTLYDGVPVLREIGGRVVP